MSQLFLKSTNKGLTGIQKAIDENRIVISKDADFLDSFLLKSEPPKLIMIKTGNVPNRELLAIFRKNLEQIIQSISRSNLIEINRNEIIEQK